MRESFVRARRPEHKQQRRAAILAAASELALTSGVAKVSLGGVAAAVGLAKSNVVRYFGTREEIYLELTAQGWRDWGAAAVTRLGEASDTEQAAAALAETLADRPLFCDLLSQVATTLEHNVSVEAAREYKHGVLGVFADVSTALRVALPTLDAAESGEVVALATGLAGMLYPVANPPQTMAELYRQDPELARLCPKFVPALKRALAAAIAGLPTLR